ncbi:hypothetical protein PHYSODRAFT_407559, partial [Phytophthora sojae]
RSLECAAEVLEKLKSRALNTLFVLPSGRSAISLAQIIGFVAQDAMLNDQVIHTCCQAVCDGVPDSAVVLSTFVFTLGFPPSPVAEHASRSSSPVDIASVKYVVLPVHLENNHWRVMVVVLEYSVSPVINVFFYEPFCRGQYKEVMEIQKWENGLLRFIRKWHEDTRPHQVFPSLEKNWLAGPRQPPGTLCCGALVVAQVHSIIHDPNYFQSLGEAISTEYVCLVRLRIMWLLLCQTKER